MTRLVLKQDNVLSFLEDLGVEGAATTNLGVIYVDDAKVYRETEEDMNLVIRAVDCYVKDPIKPSPFYSVYFHMCGHLFLQKCNRLVPSMQDAHLFRLPSFWSSK